MRLVADVAVANSTDNTVSVLLGEGAFQTQMNYTVGTSASSVMSHDFNNDNKLDLAAANVADNTVSVLLDKEDGTSVCYITEDVPIPTV
ncbi:unnamed protein product [Didymodactylos carnosus]|uniref:Uncharacterized protein n=1 Tax=Didymodactylos carnosus TaxID=1234261 RepID=A0A813YVV0_9BILA|nr:unnamed protein product [Didymodactylos carnosus]CAF0967508.1 unnamed protein product [Didymodactylos carnosus]CAF3674325.1 unnamed protein product [Didymodactylos carnosus]CAF3739195.1 unnamed protein product [Didymodactylos carnosus]